MLSHQPDASKTNPTALDLARAYSAPGRAIIPVKTDGSKAPAVRWEKYKTALPTPDEIERWFGRGGCGLALVCGAVSGGHFVLDFEFLDFYSEWALLVEEVRPGLLDELPLVRTPGKEDSGGRHVHARCTAQAVATAKLARITRDEAERRTGDPGKTTAIEVKGEKGYVLLPGCPAACHESGRLYEHVSGPPVDGAPDLDSEDVQVLLDCARALERGEKAQSEKTNGHATGNRPGDDFNRRADWLADVLVDGWKAVRHSGDVIYLCRPGKDSGVSATVGHCRSERAGPKLYVFSTNAEPFEADKAYSKFEAYTLLYHGGDFAAAAKYLGAKGYGDPPSRGAAKPSGSAPAADAPDESSPDERRPAAAIIRDHMQAIYMPTHRDGDRIWSSALRRAVRRGEALARAGGSLLMAALAAGAQEMPCDRKGNLRADAAPGVYREWAPVAWADMLMLLRDESDAEEIDPGAEEHFRRLLADALTRHMVTLAVGHRDNSERRPGREDDGPQREARTLLDWCARFARPGGWAKVRSYGVWCRRDEGGRLRVAVRYELLRQMGVRDLEDLGQDRLADLAERYGCGQRCRAGRGGQRALELSPEWLAALLENPTDSTEGDGVTANYAGARTRETAPPASPYHPTGDDTP
jgi:putative DNA primase/helicase